MGCEGRLGLPATMSLARACAFGVATFGVAASGQTATAGAGVIEPQAAMGDPLPGLTPEQLDRFATGQQDYNTQLLVTEGLGPIFNKESCANCHNNPLGGPGSQTVIRFGRDDKGSFTELEHLGGSLLQSQSIDPDNCQEVIPGDANRQSFRVTPGSLGYGLIEAIPDADLIALEQSPPGISGRANLVKLLEDPMGPDRVGRFGWKAQIATMLSFAGDAAAMEMGLTNRLIPEEQDPNGILPPDILDCDDYADPEDGPDENGLHFIDRVTDFQRYLAQPPQTPRSGMTGEAIFMQIGCGDCHTPSFTTSNDAGLEDPIRNQTIRPYSDFLLHDMGVAADGIAQAGASDREIRTPVLWGVRTRNPMWHDGRFGGNYETRMTAAIEEHGVFGSEARDAGVVGDAQNPGAWDNLSGSDQAAVLAFLDSLGRREFDHDGNGLIEFGDVQDFRDCFFGGGGYTADDACAVSDIDQDGDVDADDLASLSLVYSCFGDMDGDSVVEFDDLLAVLASWGPCGVCDEDANFDGNVDFQDLLIVLASWGPCS